MTSYFVARAHKAVWSQRAFEPSVPSYFVQLSEIKCKRRSRDCQFSFTICCLETTWSFPMTLIMPILCRDDTENNHLYYIGPFCTKKTDDKIDVIVNRIVYWALNAFHGLQSNGGIYLPVWIIPKWERLWFDQWFVSVSYDQGQKQSQIQLEVLGHSVRVRWGIKRPRYGSRMQLHYLDKLILSPWTGSICLMFIMFAISMLKHSEYGSRMQLWCFHKLILSPLTNIAPPS